MIFLGAPESWTTPQIPHMALNIRIRGAGYDWRSNWTDRSDLAERLETTCEKSGEHCAQVAAATAATTT